tara:strand:+ start:161 stop:1012 length:852 start_codon:yes stop_codon:yes gene_type:complete
MKKNKKNGAMHTILGNKIEYKDYSSSKGVTKVMYEKNYTKFTFLEDNRDINDLKVDKLVDSIRKKGQMIPIIVNEHYEVIEGQHRIKACEKLGVPISYVISIGATSKDIADINNSQSAWNNKDYLKHFSHKNHKHNAEYRQLKTFLDTHALPFHVALMLLTGGSAHPNRMKDRGPLPAFREGNFKIDDLGYANTVAGQLLKLKSFVPNLVKVNKFDLAWIKVSKLTDFEVNVAYKQIEKHSNKFDKCNNQEDWYEAMVEVYNYKLITKGKKGKKRISMRKEGF